MSQSLNILVLGLGSKVPTFIKRRLDNLAKKSVFITVAHQQKLDIANSANVRYVSKYNVSGIFSLSTLILLVTWLVKIPNNLRLWKISEGSGIARLKWCLEMQALLGIDDVDIVHAQWLIKPQTIKFIKEFYPHVTLLVSARGSQVTVYPRNSVQAVELIEYNIRNVDYIHCVSKDIEVACKRLGAPAKKLFVNYNGINSSKFIPLPRKKVVNPLRLISVGALMWRKGYIFQLQVLKKLIDMKISVMLEIIGSGNDEQGLKYSAFKMGIEQHVVFHGQKSESDVIGLLQNSDVYLSTSAAEGLPNSLVEAAACALPIVTFECEGVNEIIDNEITGFIVPFGEVNGMVEKISVLLDFEKREQMGALARQKVESEFDEDYWVDEMIKQYTIVRHKEK